MQQLDIDVLSKYLVPRPTICHKGTFGRVLIIGGHRGYSGAVRLAGEAALRVGAGCVTLATHPEHAHVLTLSCPELMCHGIKRPNTLLKKLLNTATSMVIGPGLGLDAWGWSLLRTVLEFTQIPTVIDADALTLLTQKKHRPHHPNLIFTPHPGEAARLLHTTPEVIQQDRITAIQQLYELLGGCVILKGAKTLILSEQKPITICPLGNPGMATAGMGDILTGVIAGLLAQQIPLSDAAQLGVYMHALAGDLAAESGGERGMIASDLFPYLRTTANLKTCPHSR